MKQILRFRYLCSSPHNSPFAFWAVVIYLEAFCPIFQDRTVGLDRMYHVPTIARDITMPLNSQLYGVSGQNTDIALKIQMQLTEINFALIGIPPVSKNLLTGFPNIRCSVTHRYIRSLDLTKQPAERIKKIVPGRPGKT